MKYVISNKMPNQKIRFLHLVQSFQVGGAEALLWHYLKALPQDRYDHYVYYFISDGPFKNKIEQLGVKIHKGPSLKPIKKPLPFIISLIRLFYDLLKYLKYNKIQVVQSHLRHANQLGVIAGLLTHTPAFPTIHNTNIHLDRRPKTDIRVYILKFIDSFVYRISYKIVTVSKEVKQIISKHYHINPDRIIVLKNGIHFISAPKLTRFTIKPDADYPLRILSVGRLTHQKAFEVLILSAASLIKKGFKHFSVIIAGEGEDRSKLETLISRLELTEHVFLAGVRHDIYDLMAESDIFVIPSRFEGLSIAMIEAMAVGLPIIASNAPGLNTYINHEVNGLLFPIENHDELSKLILRLASSKNLYKRLSIGSRKTFEQEFDICKNIKPFENEMANINI